jgi:ammonium transporter Rh
MQLFGIVITVVIAFVGGLIVGKILPVLGRKKEAYEDAEEFLDAAE